MMRSASGGMVRVAAVEKIAGIRSDGSPDTGDRDRGEHRGFQRTECAGASASGAAAC